MMMAKKKVPGKTLIVAWAAQTSEVTYATSVTKNSGTGLRLRRSDASSSKPGTSFQWLVEEVANNVKKA